MPNLTIQMFGDFAIQSEENRISDSDNRTRKVWQLLAFLLCHKDRIVPRKELINILWGEDSASSNPENALKTTFHRARNLLNTLWPMAGHQLILFQDSGYTWNREIPISLDTKQFETICCKEHSSTQDQPADQRLNALLYAISLYRGDFLNNLSSETWIIPIAAYFHNLYINAVLEAVALLLKQKRFSESAAVCRAALTFEPYNEALCKYLMESLLQQGNPQGAGKHRWNAQEEKRCRISSRQPKRFGIQHGCIMGDNKGIGQAEGSCQDHPKGNGKEQRCSCQDRS